MHRVESMIATLRREKALRSAHLPASAESDAGFALLLEAAGYALRGERAQSTALGIAAGLPHGVAHRHLAKLQDAGLIARAADPHDARRRYAFLTDEGAGGLIDHLLSVQNAAG